MVWQWETSIEAMGGGSGRHFAFKIQFFAFDFFCRCVAGGVYHSDGGYFWGGGCFQIQLFTFDFLLSKVQVGRVLKQCVFKHYFCIQFVCFQISGVP
jgi:hypothetical protein